MWRKNPFICRYTKFWNFSSDMYKVHFNFDVFAKNDAILISVAVKEEKNFAIPNTIVVYPLWISKNYIKWDNMSRIYLAWQVKGIN